MNGDERKGGRGIEACLMVQHTLTLSMFNMNLLFTIEFDWLGTWASFIQTINLSSSEYSHRMPHYILPECSVNILIFIGNVIFVCVCAQKCAHNNNTDMKAISIEDLSMGSLLTKIKIKMTKRQRQAKNIN